MCFNAQSFPIGTLCVRLASNGSSRTTNFIQSTPFHARRCADGPSSVYCLVHSAHATRSRQKRVANEKKRSSDCWVKTTLWQRITKKKQRNNAQLMNSRTKSKILKMTQIAPAMVGSEWELIKKRKVSEVEHRAVCTYGLQWNNNSRRTRHQILCGAAEANTQKKRTIWKFDFTSPSITWPEHYEHELNEALDSCNTVGECNFRNFHFMCFAYGELHSHRPRRYRKTAITPMPSTKMKFHLL